MILYYTESDLQRYKNLFEGNHNLQIWSIVEQISPYSYAKVSGAKIKDSNSGIILSTSINNIFDRASKDVYCGYNTERVYTHYSTTVIFWLDAVGWLDHKNIASFRDTYNILVFVMLDKLLLYYNIALSQWAKENIFSIINSLLIRLVYILGLMW